MTKDEFNRASADTVFAFTAHLKDSAFGQVAPQSQTATLNILAAAWLSVQPESVRNGVMALSPGSTDKFGRATIGIVGEKGAVNRLFREFAADITHMGFAEYSPQPAQLARTSIPGIGKR